MDAQTAAAETVEMKEEANLFLFFCFFFQSFDFLLMPLKMMRSQTPPPPCFSYFAPFPPSVESCAGRRLRRSVREDRDPLTSPRSHVRALQDVSLGL